MPERKFKDDEIREIFELATRGRDAESPSPARDADGLTLGEMQSIGAEVGLAPADVARAAVAISERAAAKPRRTSFGLPVEVGRIVPLPGPLSDDEWARLVADLRSTFNARGTVSHDAGIREWRNGNLRAMVEPTAGGYRLHMGTVKGDASALNALGLTGLAAGVATFGALALAGGLGEAVFVSTCFAVSGIGALVANIVRLPRWADRRETQMEAVASRVKKA